jgi:iron complex outermembrane receptor protein
MLALGALGSSAQAAEADTGVDRARIERLMDLKLEDILRTEVRIATKRPQQLLEIPAAVYVIQGDDITRSGARSLPEALRLAPGVDVAQQTGHDWAVGIRGMASLFADRLLVLIDGRSVYTPIFGGVFWDLEHYLLADIERIEVVRGPGGTVWGANAVNGVVNIITKSARDTQGLYSEIGGGTEERGLFSARYGAKLGDSGFGRVYVTGYDRDNFPGAFDDSRFIQTGFRTDWDLTESSSLTVQGDYFEQEGSVLWHRRATPDIFATLGDFPLSRDKFTGSGGNLLARYSRQFSEESDLQLQAYYDRVEKVFTGLPTYQDTYDLDFQHRFPLPLNQNLMYGVGYRYLPDTLKDGPLWSVAPTTRHRQLFSVFVQDQITVVEDRLTLTIGSKFEHNDFSGWDYQPSARLAWQPTDKQTVWAAVSRAAQTPSRFLPVDAMSTVIEPYLLGFAPAEGHGDVPIFLAAREPQGRAIDDSQILVAYELGYRLQVTESLFFDAAGFYNEHSKIFIGDFRGPTLLTNSIPYYLYDFYTLNGGGADLYGFEVSADWRVADWWRLVGTYSFLKARMDPDVDALSVFHEGVDPMQQFSVRSSMDLPANLALDLWTRWVDERPYWNVPAYWDLDARLAWRPLKGLEVAIVGQNLLDSRRIEFGPDPYLPSPISPVPRGGYLMVSYRY